MMGIPWWWLSDKEPTCSAGDAEDAGSVPGSERPWQETMVTYSRILAWRIPQTGEPGGL